MTVPNLQRISPELPVVNIRRAIDYYETKLGFRAVMTMPAGDYAIVERDDVAIHLFQAGHGNAPVSMHIFTAGLDELHTELKTRGAQIIQDILRKPWGNRDFRIVDDLETRLNSQTPHANIVFRETSRVITPASTTPNSRC
jgi:uncharacterized glyoxalase superfamily protein PhnB